MKIKRILSIILSIACIATLCVPTCAVESRASDQIAVYKMKVDPVSGALAVYFSVTGTGIVDKLGCESIYLYKMVDNDWVLEETKFEDDPGMSNSDTYEHTNSIRCYTEYGAYYKVVVTIFSENSKGRDTRSETFFKIGH